MQRLAPWLIAIGLMLGPVYFAMTSYIVGDPGPSFTLSERGTRWTLPDGTILHYAHGSAYRPIEVQLEPDANPIGLQLVFEATSEARTADGEDDYQATLMQSDQTILQRPLRVALKPGEQKTLNAGTLEVFYPGAYIFVLEAPTAPKVPIAQVTLNIRRHVLKPIMTVVWFGLALTAVGLALFIERWLRGMR